MLERTAGTKFHNYKLKGRRNSILWLQNQSNQELSEFQPCDKFDSVHYSVRIFVSQNGERVIVKSPTSYLAASSYESTEKYLNDCHNIIKLLERGLILLNKCYSSELPHHLYTMHFNLKQDTFWTFRLILPYILGRTLDHFIFEINNPYELLSFMLAIASELKRIHMCGVIHGDIYYNNILMYKDDRENSYKVHFIDFESAYPVNGTSITTICNNKNALRWAPERRCAASSAPAADIKQDVYSFGYMMIDLLNLNKESEFSYKNHGFKKYFPTLFSDIHSTQADNPSKRPDLDNIIKHIYDERKNLIRR